MLFPKSAEDAVKLRAENCGSVYFAGGTDVYTLGHSYPCAIDISEVVDSKIRAEEDGIHIGAMATLEAIASSELLPSMLRDAALFCPSLQQRNAATIGGNIALHYDYGYLTAALLALDAELIVETGSGRKGIKAEDYMSSPDSSLILEAVIRKDSDGIVKRVGRSSHSHMAVSAASSGDRYAYTASSSGFASGRKDSWKKISFADDGTGSAEYKRYLLSVLL